VLTSGIQALGPDIFEAAEYAKNMSARDVNEVIDYIFVEVKFFVSFVLRPNIDLSFGSTTMILSVSLCT
jgi:hypothetical protein